MGGGAALRSMHTLASQPKRRETMELSGAHMVEAWRVWVDGPACDAAGRAVGRDERVWRGILSCSERVQVRVREDEESKGGEGNSCRRTTTHKLALLDRVQRVCARLFHSSAAVLLALVPRHAPYGAAGNLLFLVSQDGCGRLSRSFRRSRACSTSGTASGGTACPHTATSRSRRPRKAVLSSQLAVPGLPRSPGLPGWHAVLLRVYTSSLSTHSPPVGSSRRWTTLSSIFSTLNRYLHASLAAFRPCGTAVNLSCFRVRAGAEDALQWPDRTAQEEDLSPSPSSPRQTPALKIPSRCTASAKLSDAPISRTRARTPLRAMPTTTPSERTPLPSRPQPRLARLVTVSRSEPAHASLATLPPLIACARHTTPLAPSSPPRPDPATPYLSRSAAPPTAPQSRPAIFRTRKRHGQRAERPPDAGWQRMTRR